MAKKLLFCAALLCAASGTAFAGGILTNTNQNVAFLRNPARDGAIGIDGTYSNPAGVAFMEDGTHVSINWQMAWQTRSIDTENPVFELSKDFNGQPQHYEGKAYAPFIPSVQAAYNKDRLSLQFNFSVTGGGGKCEFSNGLGSFEGAVGKIAAGLNQLTAVGMPTVTGYDCQSYMQGKQYYFGFTMGAAYKVTNYLSVYGGVRILYGSASYKARISDIRVLTTDKEYVFSDYLNEAQTRLGAMKSQLEPYSAVEPYASQYAMVNGALNNVNALEIYRNGVNLQSDQSAVGFAPILGADLNLGKFNLAVKYEFRTKMAMENKSTVKEPIAIEAVNQFVDGSKVREDQPSLLAFGAQYSPIKSVRINGGYHHFYDTHAKKYGDKQKLLSKGTDEYLGGAEWDITKKLTASAGFQITRYGNTDEYINDISFVVDSWSYGLGVKYQVTDKIAINAAYFKTCYDKYSTEKVAGVQNTFTRSNRVGAIGVDIDF